MNRGARLFLRVVLVLVGVGAVAVLLWEPHIEGRNAHATMFEIYFKDPFLAYAYVGSIPFFMGLYQAFKLLGYAGPNQQFAASAVRSLRTMKYCAIAVVGFVAVGEIFIVSNKTEDHAGGVFIGALITFASIVVATAMAILERALQNAVDLKTENDLTV